MQSALHHPEPRDGTEQQVLSRRVGAFVVDQIVIFGVVATLASVVLGVGGGVLGTLAEFGAVQNPLGELLEYDAQQVGRIELRHFLATRLDGLLQEVDQEFGEESLRRVNIHHDGVDITTGAVELPHPHVEAPDPPCLATGERQFLPPAAGDARSSHTPTCELRPVKRRAPIRPPAGPPAVCLRRYRRPVTYRSGPTTTRTIPRNR